MQHLKPLFVLPLLLLMGLSTASAEPPEFAASKSTAKVKVFILAGQSNMEGRGFPEPLTWQVGQEKYRYFFQKIVSCILLRNSRHRYNIKLKLVNIRYNIDCSLD